MRRWGKNNTFLVCAYSALIFFLASCTPPVADCSKTFFSEQFDSAQSICLKQYLESRDIKTLQLAVDASLNSAQPDLLDNTLSSVLLPDLADAYLYTAEQFSSKDDYASADRYFKKSATEYTLFNDPGGLSRALYGQYQIAWQYSQHQNALNLAGAALESATAAKDRDLEIQALNALFVVFEEVGTLAPARKVMGLLDELLGDEVSGMRINAYINRGLLEMSDHHYGLAAHQFDLALDAASGSTNYSALRGLHLNIAHANIKLDKLEEAQSHMKTAWSYAESDGRAQFALLYFQALLDLANNQPRVAREKLENALEDPELPPIWIWEIHYEAGRAALVEKNYELASASFQASVENLEQLHKEMGYDELKAHFTSRKRHPYEALFKIYFDNGNYEEAFRIIEQSNGRRFSDAFINVSDEALAGTKNGLNIREVSDRLDIVKVYLKNLRTTEDVTVHSNQHLAHGIGDDVVLGHFVVNHELWVTRFSKDGIRLHQIDVDPEYLDQLIIKYHDNPGDKTVLQELGQLLFPNELLPPAGHHVYVIPDRKLERIALPSLIVDSRYLIERHSLSLVPSVSALVNFREKRRSVVANSTITILGDPLGDLSGAANEARRVGKTLHTEPIIGNAANTGRLLEASNGSILHLATHSGVDHLGPWFSLADRKITADILLTNNLANELTFLASCASGASRDLNIWGSLGGVFLSGGSPSVVVSMWSVKDEATSKLAERFYPAYLANSSAAEALAMAQREAIARGEPLNTWSPFVLFGEADGRTRKHSQRQ